MSRRLSSPNKWFWSCTAVALLGVSAAVSAQNDSAPPIPIWDGEGSAPQGYGNRKVFLTPDQHGVIILWPNPDGTETKRRFDLHNTIYPVLHVHMESSSGGFQYRYDLENGKRSKDSLTIFGVVAYPDPQMQTSSALWKGGPAPGSPFNKRVGIPGAPSGLLVYWAGVEEQFLMPGASTNFTLVTQGRPGFTSASTQHFPSVQTTEEWPDEIVDQLYPVRAPSWNGHHFITLGPRYGPGDPAPGIASDYLSGMQELIRLHQLEKSSPFVKEAVAMLDAVAAGSSAQIQIRQKPQSEMEADILTALQLSLNFTYHGLPFN